MTANLDIEAFKKEGFSNEEIKEIIESEQEFEKSGITFDFEEVKSLARKELFDNCVLK